MGQRRGLRTADRRSGRAGLAALLGLVVLTACTATPTAAPPIATHPVPGGFRLVAFDSCAEALAGLRAAAQAYVGPWGFDGGGRARTAIDGDTAAAGAAQDGAARGSTAEGKAAPDSARPQDGTHSGTNNHESGVDEPDLVKTDGRRIVTVTGGTLRVIDPAARRVTGKLALVDQDAWAPWAQSQLLLHGDRALVLIPPTYGDIRRGGQKPGPDTEPARPRLVLVDLAGPPTIVSDYAIDGDLVDARQVGGTARVVVRSAPRLEFPHRPNDDDKERLAANRKVIAAAPLEAWLPGYEVTIGGTTRAGHVGCDRLVRPASYSGAALLTVLSFDLAADRATGLADGDPLTVVADGETVYSNGSRLYIANDQRWRVLPTLLGGRAAPDAKDELTEIHQFDASGPGRPRYLTSASVPGWLVNQYAMSEWDGHLRVATTSGRTWGDEPNSTSSVYVLRADGDTLTETGRVTGLGRGERIYSVRFAGPVGYVVTFRETDPLYTVDLSRPDAPRVTGELKITGYSAYLHPVAGDRLLGIGQEASTRGRTLGTQLSLFDVSDLSNPNRLAQHHVRYGRSEAEFDPHAFLYWPADRLLVVPLTTHGDAGLGRPADTSGALVLRVDDTAFTELGRVEHPPPAGAEGGPPDRIDPAHATAIRRSMMIDGVLWTFSDTAAQATDAATMRTLDVLRLTG
ncbi:beta-propeller domain-containing protein [Solwaraspora sp. WMMD1047]|uniref:beta-propeller domain-containing protein n=1 Tax=Solwaraspora sp. WMMD1047 TaxID=3016102 RepID=UPI002417E33E|nr:beta-propeller domain-containing protein [Solwaraspora sp. WMMD1047]MDG4827709.1 beta-propeller domain-containing protein [Solwaraspora sp. WMMD1047]